MARPKGTKYIETPEKMWELFEAYRKEVKSNPRIVYEFHGRDGEERQKPLERPLTIEGFKVYCYECECDVQAYFNNRDGAYEDYSPIITRIRETVRHDQIEGGVVGQYNSNLTARLNGLTEKTETKQDVTLKSIDVKIVRPDGD
jgi:hypothetical protein